MTSSPDQKATVSELRLNTPYLFRIQPALIEDETDDEVAQGPLSDESLLKTTCVGA